MLRQFEAPHVAAPVRAAVRVVLKLERLEALAKMREEEDAPAKPRRETRTPGLGKRAVVGSTWLVPLWAVSVASSPLPLFKPIHGVGGQSALSTMGDGWDGGWTFESDLFIQVLQQARSNYFYHPIFHIIVLFGSAIFISGVARRSLTASLALRSARIPFVLHPGPSTPPGHESFQHPIRLDLLSSLHLTIYNHHHNLHHRISSLLPLGYSLA